MGNPLQVLIIEDSENDALLITQTLKTGGYDPEYTRVKTVQAMRNALRDKPCDIILCDYQVPDFNGLKAIALARELHADIPLIVVSGAIGEEMVADCMRLGALDYINKNNLSRLVPAIERELAKVKSKNERRRSGQAGFGSEFRLRALFENMSSCAAIYEAVDNGADFVFKYVNRSAEITEKIERKDLIGKSLFSIFPGVREMGFWDVLQRVWRTGRAEQMPAAYYQDDRIQGWRENYVYKLPDGEVVALYSDITQRKEAEKKILESEEKYRLLVENSREVIVIAQKGMLKFVNRASVDMFDSSYEKLTTTPFIEFIHPEDREMVVSNHLRRLRGEAVPSHYTFRVVTPTSEVRWAEIRATLVSWEGKPATLNFMTDITQRKQAEEKLQKSEEKYRGILNSIEEGYYETGLDGNFTFFNDSLCRIWGYSRAEIMYMGYRKYLDKNDEKNIVDVFNQVYMTGIPTRYDYCLVGKDETRKWLEASIALIRDSAGQPTGFRGLVYDVTEHREMEDAIRQSEEKYRSIIEQMAEGYFEINLMAHFTFVNDAQCENLGYSREEMLGLHVRQYTAKDKREELYELFSGIFNTGIPVKSYDVELIKKDGTKSYHAISASLIRNAEGDPVGFRGISRDVTERKTAEIQLRNYADEISDLYNNAPCGYHSISANGSFLRINDTELKWLGYDRDEIIGRKKWSDLMTPESLTVFQKIFPVFQKQGWINDVEFDVIRKDGSIFPVLLNAKAITDEDGRYIQSSSTIFDVTQLKKTQSELKTKHLELTRAYEDLRQKQAMILQQEKMASIGMLAAGVAHEIKNPLAVILQGIDYLQTTVTDNSLPTEVIARLNKAVHQADAIIKGLLSYARQTPVALVKQDIRVLLDESLALTEHEFHAKKIKLKKEYPMDLQRISVDENQMKQVFVNLILNGIEAMPRQGKLTISIKQVKDDMGQKALQLSFQDTGHGIPADKIKNIFDPFYTTKAVGNTGLGLSISKGIIDMHGGIIYIESKEGMGTTMIIKLPLPS